MGERALRSTRLVILILCVFILAGCVGVEADLSAFLFGSSGIAELYTGDGGNSANDDFNPVVPEPSTLILLGSGLAAAYISKKRS